MNKSFRIALLSLCLYSVTGNAFAQQQDRFVYIQSDDKLPFDVSVDGKAYNSSSIGYIIIPKLVKGTYQLTISFPNKKYPDQQFSCTIDKADEGFALKNYGDKGWGLYNLQSMEISMAAGSPAAATAQAPAPENNAAFGNMLSEVVDDSTLNKQFEPIKTEKATIVADSTKSQVAANMPVDSAAVTAAALQKITQASSGEGTDVVFVDRSAGLNDTIRIFLPAIPGMAPDSATVKTIAQPDTLKTETTTTQAAIAAADTARKEPGEINNPFYKKEAAQAEGEIKQ